MHHRFKKPKVLLLASLLLSMALVIACGSSAPEPAAPQQPAGAAAPAATAPAPAGGRPAARHSSPSADPGNRRRHGAQS